MAFDPTAKLTKDDFILLPPLCTDGAWGTELAKRGAQPGQMCDTWNVEAPEKVLSVAQGYVDAGSQVILTNTFNSNRIVLEKHGIADKAYELSKAGAAISKQAAQDKAYVFASIGPCGKIVMMGEIDPSEVEAAAAEQAKAFADGGADAIVIETQSDLIEAEAAIKGVLKACDLPVGLSFTFDAGADNDRTMMGTSIPEVYELAKKYGASFVGANCGAGIETFVNIAKQFAACGTDIPIWVKGNAGKASVDENGKTVYRAQPKAYSDAVPYLLAAGAKFIGGCCGSSPEHIKAVAQAMKAAQSVLE
jgi:5-methyltetrahydrofolate--homocysteine methyltransferase